MCADPRARRGHGGATAVALRDAAERAWRRPLIGWPRPFLDRPLLPASGVPRPDWSVRNACRLPSWPLIALSFRSLPDLVVTYAVSPHQDAGTGREFVGRWSWHVIAPRMWKRNFDKLPLLEHPKAETIVFLVVDQYLDALRARPGERFEVREKSCPGAHPLEFGGPTDAEGTRPLTLDRHETTSPAAAFVFVSQCIHDIVSVQRQHDDLRESAHDSNQSTCRFCAPTEFISGNSHHLLRTIAHRPDENHVVLKPAVCDDRCCCDRARSWRRVRTHSASARLRVDRWRVSRAVRHRRRPVDARRALAATLRRPRIRSCRTGHFRWCGPEFTGSNTSRSRASASSQGVPEVLPAGDVPQTD